MSSENQYSKQRVAWQTAIGQEPEHGPKSMPLSVDFTLENPANFNLQNEEIRKIMAQAQGIFVDNSANSYQLTITMRGTGQVIVIPPTSQAYLPICATDNAHLQFATTGTPVIPIQLLNFPVKPVIWSVNGNIPGGGNSGIDHSANAPSLAGQALVAAAPANLNRNVLGYQNQSAVQQYLVLYQATGATILIIAPGTGADTQGGAYTAQGFKGRAEVYSALGTDAVALYEY